MAKEIELQVKGLTIRGQQWGAPEGQRILCLHGWLDNSASFDFLGPKLDDLCVVAIDLPGHGLSGHWPDYQHYHLWAAVEDIDCILLALGWDSCILLGHSMGAAMATLYAGTFPSKVEQLILIEAIGPMAGDLEGAPERLAKAIVTMRELNPQQGRRPSISGFIESRLSGHLSLSRQASEAITRRAVAKDDGGYYWRNDKRLKLTSMMRLPEPLIQSFIRSIQSRTLGIFAEKGLFSRESLPLRWDCISAPKQLVWLDGGHHLHMEEQYQEVADHILAFLRSDHEA